MTAYTPQWLFSSSCLALWVGEGVSLSFWPYLLPLIGSILSWRWHDNGTFIFSVSPLIGQWFQSHSPLMVWLVSEKRGTDVWLKRGHLNFEQKAVIWRTLISSLSQEALKKYNWSPSFSKRLEHYPQANDVLLIKNGLRRNPWFAVGGDLSTVTQWFMVSSLRHLL